MSCFKTRKDRIGDALHRTEFTFVRKLAVGQLVKGCFLYYTQGLSGEKKRQVGVRSKLRWANFDFGPAQDGWWFVFYFRPTLRNDTLPSSVLK